MTQKDVLSKLCIENTYDGVSVFRLHRAIDICVPPWSPLVVAKGNWAGCGVWASLNEKFPNSKGVAQLSIWGLNWPTGITGEDRTKGIWLQSIGWKLCKGYGSKPKTEGRFSWFGSPVMVFIHAVQQWGLSSLSVADIRIILLFVNYFQQLRQTVRLLSNSAKSKYVTCQCQHVFDSKAHAQ